jgi:hypothetical protein
MNYIRYTKFFNALWIITAIPSLGFIAASVFDLDGRQARSRELEQITANFSKKPSEAEANRVKERIESMNKEYNASWSITGICLTGMLLASGVNGIMVFKLHRAIRREAGGTK